MRWLLGAILICCLSSTASAYEKRCGWYQNPTPGHHILTDRHAEWILGAQAEGLAKGYEDVKRKSPDIWKSASWVKPYPSVCGCFEGVFGEIIEKQGSKFGNVDLIFTIEELPLDRCENDPSLPKKK